MMQPRFERRVGSAPLSLIDQPRYRAGYDFLRLRAEAGEADVELADWWEDFALGDNDEREALLAAARESAAARRVPRATAAPRREAGAESPRARPAAGRVDAQEIEAGEDGDAPTDDPHDAESSGDGDLTSDAPVKRRRRRRRKPQGSGASSTDASGGSEGGSGAT